MKYLLIGLLKTWRLLVSPWYGNVCRYYPSCSAYALRAVQYHGAWRGSYLAVRRLLSCHPWSPGGYDPVRGTPEFDEEMRSQRAQATTMGQESKPASAAGQREAMTAGREAMTAGREAMTAGHEAMTAGQHRHAHQAQGEAGTVAQGLGDVARAGGATC